MERKIYTTATAESSYQAPFTIMKVYRIQIRNFGAVAWRMYDKKEYSETAAITLVATLNRVDPFHYFRKVRIR